MFPALIFYLCRFSIMTSSKRSIKTALVVEGGAMRGIFACGVLDAFLSKEFNPFDLCIGVSAGTTNAAAYLAGMYRRNHKVYLDYSLRREFISWRRFISGGHLLDLDWMWDITIREVRLKIDVIAKSRTLFLIGLTNAHTGKAEYVTPAKGDIEHVLKASCAIPVFYRGFVEYKGTQYTDGGIADPIPVREAARRGASAIVVIRSRPKSALLDKGKGNFLTNLFLRNSRSLAQTVSGRPDVYNASISFLRKPPEGVTIFEINPPEDFKTKRLTKDPAVLEADYLKGFEAGMTFMKQWKRRKR
jgi:predicted patatin/cPLA2 family phospholipase